MKAKLMVREAGSKVFAQKNGDFNDIVVSHPMIGNIIQLYGHELALQEGERCCREGNIEAFEVWTLFTGRRRVWAFEEL